MTKKVKITELLNPKKFEKYKDDLVKYFGNGGTWESLLGYDEDVMMAQYKKAYDLYQQAQYKDAAACFSYLTTLNPYQYSYWMGLGISKQSDRLYEEALVSYTAAEAIDPDNPLPHLHLSQCYYALRLNEPAIEHLKRVLETAGDKAEYAEVRKKAQVILDHLRK